MTKKISKDVYKRQVISKAFMNFELNGSENSGRFNIYDYNERKIILDYGHNFEGYNAVLNSLNKIKNKNNIIGVIGVPGDRQNEMIEKIGELCSEKLDKIVIKEDIDKRGRREGEIASLLNQSIVKRNKEIKPRICLDEIKALEEALNISEKGDIIVVFYEKLKPLLDFIDNNRGMNNEFCLLYTSCYHKK